MKNNLPVKFFEVTKTFGETVAVDSADFSIQKGEFFGLLGPNGAGKTTLIKILIGLAVLDVLVKVNPVTHMINGLRYGMIGVSELNLTIGLAGLLSLAAILFLLCVNLFRRGYHLRV